MASAMEPADPGARKPLSDRAGPAEAGPLPSRLLGPRPIKPSLSESRLHGFDAGFTTLAASGHRPARCAKTRWSYSDSPAASRAESWSPYQHTRTTLPPRNVNTNA
jgi:hypothetical protein